ncbi:MAG: methylmalonyl Co-A mutase-associated GTPase MeaB [Rhodospirillales bacterium]|nr:methylmalonyl Co-A mutase-associated GTPase MeaB [Rhodospirillales bacterium]
MAALAAEQADPARPPVRRAAPAVDDFVRGVLAHDRALLGRTITLIESKNAAHNALANEILVKLLPHTGGAYRIGVTGVPGVGKSTFIEAFGCYLIDKGHRVAVLAVDPTSPLSGGSILGDKTRMVNLGQREEAFIRPSPSGGTLGGVTKTTRQTMVACDAAGYDVILVETVGTGQSEIAVSDMTDFFLVLMLPGAGDELQGIKKGVLEIADMIVVNKADGDNEIRARQAVIHYRNALHITQPKTPTWQPPVGMCSALKEHGLGEIWAHLEEYQGKLTATGEWQQKRQKQRVKWMWAMVQDKLMSDFRNSPAIVDALPSIETELLSGRLTVTLAVERLLGLYHR